MMTDPKNNPTPTDMSPADPLSDELAAVERALAQHTPAALSARVLQDAELALFSAELSTISPAALKPAILERAELELFGASLVQHRPSPLKEEHLEAFDDAQIEAELAQLHPARLDRSYLDMLAQIPAEVALAALPPAPLSPEMLDRLSATLEAAEDAPALEPNVIPFPQQEPADKRNWRWMASAAAVAVIGVFCGLMIKPGQQFNGSSSFVASSASDEPLSHNLLNVSTESTVLQAQDQGIVPYKDSDSVKYRAMRVVEIETRTMKDQHGNTIEVNRPVQKTILVPVEAD